MLVSVFETGAIFGEEDEGFSEAVTNNMDLCCSLRA